MRIGLIGAGTIGKRLIQELKKDEYFELVGVYDKSAEKLKSLKDVELKGIDELIDGCELIIEAASKEAVKTYVKKALLNNKDVFVMSVGGLLEDLEILDIAKEKQRKIYIPSGAICGIDGVKACCLSGIKSIILTTRKNPKAFQGAPYISKKNIDLYNIKESQILFEGDVLEAVQNFPANINISASLALCLINIQGINKDTLRKLFKVKIIADPTINVNIHHLYIESQAGKINITCENLPDEKNPKTSKLAIYSAISTLKKLKENILIGN
jgi:aspartate dehydrogenase